MIHTTKNKYTYTSRVPGLTEHLLPTCAGIFGNAFGQCHYMGLVDEWMNEWNQSMEPTQQLLALLLQFQSIQGNCKPTEKPRNPGPETGCVLSRKTDAEEPGCATPKTSEADDCKIWVPYSVMLTPICILCPQCIFMLVLCSDRQFPKGILNYYFKLSKSLFNYQQTAQYIPLSWRCFLSQPSLLRQKTLQVYLSPFEGGQDD